MLTNPQVKNHSPTVLIPKSGTATIKEKTTSGQESVASKQQDTGQTLPTAHLHFTAFQHNSQAHTLLSSNMLNIRPNCWPQLVVACTTETQVLGKAGSGGSADSPTKIRS